MNLALALLLIAIITNVLLGFIVLSINTRSMAARVFLVLCVFTSVWAISNHLTEYGSSLAISSFFNRIAYSSAILAICSGALFTFYFPSDRHLRKRTKVMAVVTSSSLAVFSLTTAVAGMVTQNPAGGYIFTQGSFIYVYVVAVLGLITMIIRNLTKTVRRGNRAQKSQAKIILFGFVATTFLGLMASVILPIISDWRIAQFGPSLSIILVASITYAMVRHGLFDFRAVIVRSAGYVISLLVFAMIYGLLVFGIIQQVLDVSFPLWVEVVISLSTALASLVVPLLKKFFDRITSKFFYRDSYDPQQLLDDLNERMVGQVDLDVLGRDVTQVLANHFKAEFVILSLSQGHLFKSGNATKQPDARALHALGELLDDQGLRVVSSYRISFEKGMHALHGAMESNGIAAAIEIRDGAKLIGRVYYGYKLGGDEYSTFDLRLMQIIANQASLAVSNATRFEEIEQFSVTLQEKVDAATYNLKRSNARLKLMDERKNEFIGMSSHQLRTPLTAIKGYISLVLEGDMGPLTPQQRQALDQALVSSQRMVYLIADLLNMARIRSGKFVITNVPSDLAEIMEGEVDQLQYTAKARGVELTYRHSENFPKIYIDETKIRQVAMNFMDNAIYYGKSGGHIWVELKETEKTIEFTVTDDGIGVPRHEQQHLFDKFYRAGNARKARPDGTGLGLFLAKKTIIAQGGALIFKSREGHGSTFGFTIAKSKVAIPDHIDSMTAPVGNPLV